MPKKRTDLSDIKFGMLTVLKPLKEAGSNTVWECICDCGQAKNIQAAHLKNGSTLSCGCYRSKKITASNTKHGYSHHPLYPVWMAMKDRCYNPDNRAYKNYGGRGVRVCEEWLNNPVAFIVWALKNGWTKGLDIDKDKKAVGLGITPNLYSTEYCQFITPKENQNHRRNNHLLTVGGVTNTVTQWSGILGIKRSVIWTRISRGWTDEEVINTPIRKRKQKLWS